MIELGAAPNVKFAVWVSPTLAVYEASPGNKLTETGAGGAGAGVGAGADGAAGADVPPLLTVTV